MQKSHLVAIFKTFSKKEVRELRKWLHSPAHNQREDVIKLFEFLVESDHLRQNELLSKENVYSWVFPRVPFDDAHMRQVMHFLLKAVESFLIYEELQNDPVGASISLARVFRKRKLDRPFQKMFKAVRQKQAKNAYRDGVYLQNEFLLEYENYVYLSGLKRTVPLNLQEVSGALDLSYIVNKLRQSCLMVAHQTVFKTEYEMGLLQAVTDYVEQNDLLHIPAVAIYYYNYKSITERENETHFQNLKQEIFKSSTLFPQSEMRDIFLLALNYCIERMNAGHQEYIREAFELYQRGFEQKTLLDNNILSRWTFRNLVSICLRLKEFRWVENFIEDYQQFLSPRYRDNFVHYSQANMYYEKGQYDKAMRLFSQVEYDDILINLSAKTRLLKMLFLENEMDTLESLLESMRTYVQRKEVMGYHKANYKNIIRYAKKLIHVNPYSQPQREKLKKEIEATQPLTEKKWLLEQLENL